MKKFFPTVSFWVMFVPSFILGWFVAISSWNRTFENFINYTVVMMVLFFPIYLATLESKGFNTESKIVKFLNNKVFVWSFLILYFIFVIYILSIFKMSL